MAATQRRIDVTIESVRRLLRVGATPNLVNLLQKLHPADLAQVFAELPERERHAAFNTLVERNGRLAMEAVSELGPEKGAELLALRSAEEIARLLQEIESDDAAALIESLSDDLRVAVLALIHPKPGGGVSELLEYEERTAGRLMNPNVFALPEDVTAGEAITALQSARDVEMVFYLYVVDERRHLVGVVSLRRLLLVPPDTPLKRIMTTEVYSASVDLDQEEVARRVASYNLLAIPVVDQENKLVGVITVDDVIDVIKDEATEEIYRLAGVSIDDGVDTPPAESLRRRLPWLVLNLVTAFVSATVVARFTDVIEQVVILAALMPVVAGLGGNAATQTLAVVVRGISMGELTGTNARQALLKESFVGLGNGLVIGLVGATAVWAFTGFQWALGFILMAAMIINMSVAAIAGTLIPIGLRAMKVDPALASSVFITALTDVIGFLSFLGLATVFVRYL
ncbi:MAG: magnesium transporter [Acidobacteriota bacterium]|jgi:magnesium transporter|nr:MAG: magnesium transporter [Acidobacteriota bacterium]